MQRTAKVFFSLVLFALTLTSFGQTVSNTSQRLGSGPYFYADDGNCSNASEIPRAAYILVNVINNSSSDTLFNVNVKMTNISNTAAGFKLLSFEDDSTFVIPRILPNDSSPSYFYVQYPCTKDSSCDFTFSIFDTDTVTFIPTITTKDIQPAAAGGDIISQNIVGLDALGILIADSITYDFGNFNGEDMFFQPCGDTLFPVNSLELIGTEVITSPFSSCGLSPGDQNKLYLFDNGSGCGAGSGNQVQVVYYWLSSLYNETAYFKPYAGMKSGSVIKYLSNYGSGAAVDSFTTTTASISTMILGKRASCGICTPGDTITYTVTMFNSSSAPAMVDYIQDSMPDGYTFIGIDPSSDVNELNSSAYPATNDSGILYFVGKIPTTPFPYRSYVVPANDSIKLIYQVEIPGTSSNTVFENQVIAYVGSTAFDTATALTCAGCSILPVSLISFSGEAFDDHVKLEWTTASEIDNDGFELYRMHPNEYLGFVKGAGNSTSINNYSFTDHKVLHQSQQYKLVQRDFSGKRTEQFTVVKPNVNRSNFVLHPNPSAGKIQIVTNGKYSLYSYNIYSTTGQLLQVHNQESNITSINLEDFSGQVVYVEAICDGILLGRQRVVLIK